MNVHKGERFDGANWENRAESLVKISEAAYWAESPEVTYRNMLEAVFAAVHCDVAVLHLLSSDETALVRYMHTGDDVLPLSEWNDNLPITIGRLSNLLHAATPIIMDYAHPHHDDQIPAGAFEAGYKSAITVPVIANRVILGTCSLVYKRALVWPDEDVSFFMQIGRMLGSATQRMRAAKKSAELALLHDRQMLSAEIHDNVSHLIGALSLQAGCIMASYDEQDLPAVERGLERFEETCGDTMRVLRDEMLSLRAPLESTEDWLGSVKEILAHFENAWSIPINLEEDIRSTSLSVNLQVALQLTRILNECLSNVVRHAHASRITVHIQENISSLKLVISDNGHGFDMDDVAPERLGLKIMHERAALMDGKLVIQSGANGTTVTVEIPQTCR